VFQTRPLGNFPHIRTRHAEDLREAFELVYSKPTLQFFDRATPLDATFNDCWLSQVGVGYFSCGTPLGMEFAHTDCHLLIFPIAGKGEIVVGKTTAPLTPNRAATISGEMSHSRKYSADYEHLSLRIDSATLIQKLRAMTGAAIDRPLQIHPALNFKRPATQLLRRYFILLVNEIGASTTPLPSWMQSQIQQMLMVMFLYANQHNYSHLLEQPSPVAGASQARHAEEYIAANRDRSIDFEDLATVAGVSTLSLIRASKKVRQSLLEFPVPLRRSNEGASDENS
jgi:AraC-binding-like domain